MKIPTLLVSNRIKGSCVVNRNVSVLIRRINKSFLQKVTHNAILVLTYFWSDSNFIRKLLYVMLHSNNFFFILFACIHRRSHWLKQLVWLFRQLKSMIINCFMLLFVDSTIVQIPTYIWNAPLPQRYIVRSNQHIPLC